MSKKRTGGWNAVLVIGVTGLALAGGCASEPPSKPAARPGSADPATVTTVPSGAPVIRVANDSSLTLGGRKINAADIVGRLRKAEGAADTEIRLISAPDAPFNTVVAVMRNLKDNGFSRVNLIVEKAPTPAPAKD